MVRLIGRLLHRRRTGPTDTELQLENGNADQTSKQEKQRNLCWKRTKFIFQLSLLVLALSWLRKVRGIITGTIDGYQGTTHNINDWIVVSGPKDGPAIVMLSDGSSKLNKFQNASIEGKVAYAKQHNFTLILCRSRLDEYRPANWSKLKLLYKVLTETQYKPLLWLDVDTIIWDRTKTPSISPSTSITAQLDLHRTVQSKYLNSGVMLLQKTDWMLEILKKAYRQWQIPLLQGIFYFDADQDALNTVMRASASLDSNFDLKFYQDLWSLGKDRRRTTYVLHFPNCVRGRCTPEFLKLQKEATEMRI